MDQELVEEPFDLPDCLSTAEDVFNLFILLSRDWPNLLTFRLIHSEFKKKYVLLVILKSLFSIKFEHIHLSLASHLYFKVKCIWQAFLSCFLDSEEDIKLISLKIASIIFQTEQNRMILKSLQKQLVLILKDKEAVVRLMGLEVIRCIRQEDIVSSMYKNVFDKISDLNLSIRKSAIRVAGQIFQKFWKKTDPFYAEKDNLYKLASACLLRFTSEEEEEEIVKEVTQTDFIDCNSSSRTKALRLLYLLIFCHNSAVQNLGHILIHQLQARRVFHKMMQCLSTSNTNKDQFNFHLLSINQHFSDIYSYEDNLNQFFSQINASQIQQVEMLFGQELLEADQVTNILSTLINLPDTEKEKQDSNLEQFYSALILRTGLYLFDKDMMLVFLDEINHFAQIDNKFVPRLAAIITFISNCYSIFKDKDISQKFLHLNEKILILMMTTHFKPYLICEPELIDDIHKLWSETV